MVLQHLVSCRIRERGRLYILTDFTNEVKENCALRIPYIGLRLGLGLGVRSRVRVRVT